MPRSPRRRSRDEEPRGQVAHGTRVDEYYWLRDDTRKDAEVLAYLAAENAYKDTVLAPHRPLEEQLYAGDHRAPSSRTTPACRSSSAGTVLHAVRDRSEYPVHARQGDARRTRAGDARRRGHGEGHDFFNVGSLEVSPEAAWLLSPRTRWVAGSSRCASRTSRPPGAARRGPECPARRRVGADNRSVLYVEKDRRRCSAPRCAGTS